ncbi:MAG: hypothetical protein Q8L00_03345 [Deltaproteobacteria bacterium]|nr:hypothetical protein [Deltaproteobacteria bacterium]
MILGRFCLIWLIYLLLSPCSGLAAHPQSGVIEGSLSYPSEFIPDDMTICAENLATKKIYCTNKHLNARKYRYKVGYKLPVPPGDYHVFAQLPDPARYGATYPKDYRAYYSQFVKCGMSVECQDHTPIVVQVKSGETASGIDPWDWYK